MGIVVQLLQRSTKPAHASADGIQVDAVQMPPRVTRDKIAAATTKYEKLCQNIDALRRSLKTLDGIAGMIDDPETRETLQHQLKSIDATLSFESARLSGIKREIQKRVDWKNGAP